MGVAGSSGSCYDWIMWSYNASTCTGIQSNTLAPVACNWNGACGGFTGMANTVPAGGSALDFEAGMNVTCGQQFIVCFSNYSSAVTSVPLSFFGTASVSCTTFTPITVSNATVCPGTCATLTASGGTTYNWTASPDLSGTTGATVSACPPGTGTYNYTVTGTGACGTGTATATVTVLPASDPLCSTPCNLDYFSANISACDFATNTYSVDGDIQFTGAPASGQLIVETCGGQQQVFNAPFASPLVYNITGIPSDGAACDVQVYFTADPACSQTIPYTAPASCACPVDIGTFTTGTTGSTTTTGPYNLCWGDALNVVSNGNNTDPNNIFDPTITYDPGQWLLVYSCPPTVGPPNDINTDPCLLGVFSTADANWNIPNNVGDGSTLYFVPIRYV